MRQMRIGVRRDDSFSPPLMRVIHVRSQPTASASFWSVRDSARIASATVLNLGGSLLLRAMQRIVVTSAHECNNKMCVGVTVSKTHQIGLKIAYSLRRSVKTDSLQERVRSRLRQLVTAGNVSHDLLAEHVGVSRSHITRLLNENGAILLTHIEKMCVFFQVSPSELMVEPGSQIQPLTPMEAGLLQYFRHMTEVQRMGLMAVLDRSAQQATSRRRARLGRAELTEEQQLLVDLYARSPEQARRGILKTLRGTATIGDAERGARRTPE